MAIFKKKNDSDDGTIDSVEEMVEYEEKKLWEQNPMEALNHNNVEKRKKMNWYARFVLSLIIVTTFIFLVWVHGGGNSYGARPARGGGLTTLLLTTHYSLLTTHSSLLATLR